jgi:hypothetical protein
MAKPEDSSGVLNGETEYEFSPRLENLKTGFRSSLYQRKIYFFHLPNLLKMNLVFLPVSI